MKNLIIKNLTNSPFDLEGGVRLPAMGTVTASFSDEYASALMVVPGVEVTEAVPHGEKDKRAILEAMSDSELRAFVEKMTGRKPHWKASRETLIEKALSGE